MESDEAVTLLLKTIDVEDIWREASRNLAKPIVETLGYLALAIVQAGAIIRQRLCSMGEFCGMYNYRRKQLLSRQPIQIKADYFEAMIYLNLLYRQQAVIEKDPARQQQLMAEADRVRNQAVELVRKKKAAAAAGAKS